MISVFNVSWASNYNNHGEIIMIKRFLNDQSGATAIEYGMIASLIAITIVGSAQTISVKLVEIFTIVLQSI